MNGVLFVRPSRPLKGAKSHFSGGELFHYIHVCTSNLFHQVPRVEVQNHYNHKIHAPSNFQTLGIPYSPKYWIDPKRCTRRIVLKQKPA